MIRNETLLRYLRQYEAEHTKVATRVTHFVGIPMIVASLPLLPTLPPVGAGMFAAGWGLQLVGHCIEGNRPAFLRDPVYLLVGPLWVALELLELLLGMRLVPDASAGTPAAGAAGATDG